VHLLLVLEGDGRVVVERVVAAVLPQGRTLDQQADQNVGLEDLLQFGRVAVLRLLQEGLGDVECAVLEVAAEEHALGDGEFED
jgi:hypothetical protein